MTFGSQDVFINAQCNIGFNKFRWDECAHKDQEVHQASSAIDNNELKDLVQANLCKAVPEFANELDLERWNNLRKI